MVAGMQSSVTLHIDGVRYNGWTKARVTRSLDAVAGTFGLSLTERWPGRKTIRPIKPFSSCTVQLDGETVITGYVDEVQPSYDATSHEISVSGRDRTGDLVDCSASHSPGEWHNASVERIAQELANPFGVDVKVGLAAPRFKRFRLEEGETAFEALDRLCRMRALLATSDVHGNLHLVRSGNGGTASVVLERGVNILSASGTFSGKDRYSTYTVKAQQPGLDVDPQDAAQISGHVGDGAVPRHRPLVMLAEDAADPSSAQTRAQWERDTRKARANTVTVSVQGWRERPSGPLWMPNKLVRLRDSWLGIDALLLISSVEMTFSGDGSLTKLQLISPQAFALRAEPEQEVSEWT